MTGVQTCALPISDFFIFVKVNITMVYDLIIIGGGPAAVAAGVYAARKRIKSLIICKDWGGQSKVSAEVQNFIGIKSLPGTELAERLEEHVKAYADDVLDFDEGSLVTKISKAPDFDEKNPIFNAETDKGKKYQAKSLIVTARSPITTFYIS